MGVEGGNGGGEGGAKYIWCLTSTETVRDGEKGGVCVCGGGGGMEVREEGDYIPIATLSLPE